MLSDVKEQTGAAIAEFKRKCEKKMKDMKERYKEDIDAKDNIIAGLRAELVEKNDAFENESEKLKEMVRTNRMSLYVFTVYYFTSSILYFTMVVDHP